MGVTRAQVGGWLKELLNRPKAEIESSVQSRLTEAGEPENSVKAILNDLSSYAEYEPREPD